MILFACCERYRPEVLRRALVDRRFFEHWPHWPRRSSRSAAIHTGNWASSASVTQASGAFAAGAAMPTMTSSGGVPPLELADPPGGSFLWANGFAGRPGDPASFAHNRAAGAARRPATWRGRGAAGCACDLLPESRSAAPQVGDGVVDPVRQAVPLGSVLANHPCSDGGKRAGGEMRSRHSVWRCPPRSWSGVRRSRAVRKPRPTRRRSCLPSPRSQESG